MHSIIFALLLMVGDDLRVRPSYTPDYERAQEAANLYDIHRQAAEELFDGFEAEFSQAFEAVFGRSSPKQVTVVLPPRSSQLAQQFVVIYVDEPKGKRRQIYKFELRLNLDLSKKANKSVQKAARAMK